MLQTRNHCVALGLRPLNLTLAVRSRGWQSVLDLFSRRAAWLSQIPSERKGSLSPSSETECRGQAVHPPERG